MGKSLVIVESPAKARTIHRYLGDAYTVRASMGHVRDLPKRGLAVDIDNRFAPVYRVIADKRKVVAEIRRAAARADAIYIATDPDREGEAIGWHLLELLDGDRRPVYRVLLEEITEQGVRRAFANPGQLDMNKVNAQQARRILDRLVGYKISPLLWEKVRRGLSAGRVQSVALRLVVDRERQIEAFVPEEYWSIVAQLEADEPPLFDAELRQRQGSKIEIPDEAGARRILAELGAGDERTGPAPEWRVARVEAKQRRRRPQPPFTTSQLQQSAYRRLRYPVRKTMSVAQQLYEGIELGPEGSVGLITYMRTDSTRVSEEAVAEVRQLIATSFGPEFVPPRPRRYRSAKGAQEAHEAIRPTSVARTPEELRRHLTDDQFRLYELIWRRFVASQMRDAVYDTTTADIAAGPYTFRATGSLVRFPGYLGVYGDPEDEEEQGRRLPPLHEGQVLRCLRLTPKQHFTQPPPRFTEATLVRELERNGIGRPSTYAEILSKIRNRDYVRVEKGRFVPTELGRVVVDLLVENFGRIMDIGYTARVEDRLDKIEAGREDWIEALGRFWRRFSRELETAQRRMRDIRREAIATEETCEECGKPMVIRWGRFGRFLACTGYPGCRNTRPLATRGEGDPGPDGPAPETPQPEPTGEPCPECGAPLVRRSGRFGPFVGCSNFPRCRYVQPKGTGVRCPECGEGELVQKRTRRRRLFYGCDRFPDCKFATWNEPVPTACPACGHPFLEARRQRGLPEALACPNRACGYVAEPQPVEAPD